MLRRLATLLVPVLVPVLAVVLAAGLVVGSAGSASAAPKPGKQGKPALTYAAKAHQATNQQRAAAGLRTLRTDDCLLRFARRQAERMSAAGEIYHQDLGAVMRRCGLRAAGENVAHGYSSGTAVVVDGWMASDGHRANILSTAYRIEAIAAVRGGDGRWYAAQVFGRRG